MIYKVRLIDSLDEEWWRLRVQGPYTLCLEVSKTRKWCPPPGSPFVLVLLPCYLC